MHGGWSAQMKLKWKLKVKGHTCENGEIKDMAEMRLKLKGRDRVCIWHGWGRGGFI